jgi:methylmalonyl-CoA/ethylmalonyl-CoA epimerase
MVALNQIGQIAITVSDMPRTVTFYRDTLGMRFLFDAGPNLSFFDCGGVRVMLDIPQEAEFIHPASVLYYKVADIAAAHRELLAKGVKFIDEPHVIARLPSHDLWMTFARDSEGNVFALMSEVTR